MLPEAEWEVPYEGAKPMLLVDDVDSRPFLQKLMEALLEEQ
jgi:hypothetical protein